jgi:hypothetical protein
VTHTAFDNGIIRRIFGSDDEKLSPEVARFFLGLSLTDADNERIAELSEKSNAGTLSTDERDEPGMYMLAGDLVAIMQSRARLSLKNHSPAA